MAIEAYLIGCDLGKSVDYTSLSFIEMEYDPAIEDCRYHLKALDRIKGVDYPVIVDLIERLVERLEKEMHVYDDFPFGSPCLCMDASGLGAPIKDFLNAKHIFNTKGRKLFPVVYTGGEAARYDLETRNFNISKTLIISNFLSLMQHHRFDYAPDLQALALLEQEIAVFKYHLTPSGKATFNAEEGHHDDLINCIAIPLIIGEWKFAKRLRK